MKDNQRKAMFAKISNRRLKRGRIYRVNPLIVDPYYLRGKKVLYIGKQGQVFNVISASGTRRASYGSIDNLITERSYKELQKKLGKRYIESLY